MLWLWKAETCSICPCVRFADCSMELWWGEVIPSLCHVPTLPPGWCLLGPWDTCSRRRDEGSAFASMQLSDSSEGLRTVMFRMPPLWVEKKSYLPHNLISYNWVPVEGRISNGGLDFHPLLYDTEHVCVSCSILFRRMLMLTHTRPGPRVWSMKVMSQRKQEDPQRMSRWVKSRESAELDHDVWEASHHGVP